MTYGVFMWVSEFFKRHQFCRPAKKAKCKHCDDAMCLRIQLSESQRLLLRTFDPIIQRQRETQLVSSCTAHEKWKEMCMAITLILLNFFEFITCADVPNIRGIGYFFMFSYFLFSFSFLFCCSTYFGCRISFVGHRVSVMLLIQTNLTISGARAQTQLGKM